jgi:hypothetical protein
LHLLLSATSLFTDTDHLPDRVRAHILLCMLAYCVEWHMREAWRALLFADEDQAAKAARDPVAPARRSQQAERKAPAHSFRTLLDELSTIVQHLQHHDRFSALAYLHDRDTAECRSTARAQSCSR